MTVTINGDGSVTGLTTLPDSAMASGSVIQVVHDFDITSAGFATTSGSYVTNSVLPTLAITPSSSSSKIYVSAFIGMQNDGGSQIENTIYRIISGGSTTDLSGGNTYGLVFKGGSNSEWGYSGVQFVDSPNTTSQVTYTWYGRSEVPGLSVALRHAGSTVGITLMEIKS